MKEYWVNVYRYCGELIYGCHYYNKIEALMEGSKIQHVTYIYRIHVKMDGGYNKRKVKPFPQRIDMKMYNNKEWMG